MKQPTFNGKELLPLSVMEAAHAGDAMAMERVLRYYEGYINKLCTRTLYDSNGFPYVCVDEYMKRRLEIKLIHSIVVALEYHYTIVTRKNQPPFTLAKCLLRIFCRLSPSAAKLIRTAVSPQRKQYGFLICSK